MRIAFVTNFASHYRVKTFETLARYHDVKYLFFSGGREWYWQKQHGTRTGAFDYEYLPGMSFAGTQITPSLFWRLLGGKFDVVLKCINGRFALPAAYISARLRGKPFVLWTGIWNSINTRFHRAAAFLTNYIYRHADAIVVYGEHVKRFLIEQGVDGKRIFVAAHAVDNAAYSRNIPAPEIRVLREKLKIPEHAPVALFLGRLEEMKGLDYLLEAFVKVSPSNAILVMAGNGSEKERLMARAAQLGLIERIRFAGYVPIESAPTYYAMASLYVLPSVTTPTAKEPWGLVVNEAFNQGVPVVATDAVGAAAGGLVEDGVNGFIVPERDSNSLATAISSILGDPELHDRLSQAARSKIRAWDNEQMVRGFRNAIDFACRNRNS